LLAIWIAMAGSDRALMLALPALAVLAAFALPTLKRSAAAAIDWFSVFFFSIPVATGWVFYVAMQTGTPAKLAANVARLSPAYPRTFSALALALALAGTLAWLWLFALLAVRDLGGWVLLRGWGRAWLPVVLGPLRELAAPFAWLSGGLKRHVSWHGQRLLLSSGTLLYAEHPAATEHQPERAEISADSSAGARMPNTSRSSTRRTI